MATGQPVSSNSFLDRLYAKINKGLDDFGTASPAQIAAAARRPRKLWSVAIAGVDYKVEIKSKWKRWDSGPRLFVNGTRTPNLVSPGVKHPRTEAHFEVGGSQVILALEWRADWAENLRVDLFVDGVSLLDGGDLEQARANAPTRISRYDFYLRKLQRSLSSTLYLVPILGFSTAVSAGCAAGAAIGVITAVWETGFGAGLLLVNRRNLAHPELGALRWLLLAGFVVGYPIVSYAIALLTLTPR